MKFALSITGAVAAAAAIGTVAFVPERAAATTFIEEEFECPIGGEKFKANVMMSNFTMGQRADGKPYGGVAVWPIPECPENGLILFEDDFSDDDLAALAVAIQTPEFRSMRDTDTSRYRLYWLKREIGRSVSEQIGALYEAIWQTDEDWDRKIRYQAEFVKVATGWERPVDPESAERIGWFWMNMRAVNTLRELGYYEEALGHLHFVTKAEHLPLDEETAGNAQFYADQLELLLEERNPHPEPVNLTPLEVAIFRCVMGEGLTPVEETKCAEQTIQDKIADFSFKPKGEKKLFGEAAVMAAHSQWSAEGHRH